MKSTLLIIVAVVMTTGCKTAEDTVVGKPPPTASAPVAAPAPRTEAAPRAQLPPPRLTIPSWPYAEPGTTFALSWSGGNERTGLYASPDPNSRLIGDVVWDNGERILWRDTAMSSYQPRIVRANDDWFVEGPVYRDGYLVDQEFVNLEVKKGERLEIWAYAGDLQCYMAKRSEVVTGPCPPPDLFSGLGKGQVRAEWYMPEQKVWWIQINGDGVSGWVVVDDRMTLDIVDE